ncbi:MAG: zincin-like metallopeptidase domain-containing protein [Devosia sp.]|nr:zincin-like metallopeptidase domain-containing protein [Devosia sp.]
MSASDRADVYSRVTQEIITAIEAGDSRYRMPWHHDGAAVTRPINLTSGRPYRGINVVSLWAAAQAKGYAGGVWATFRQWQAQGAQVRKGEKASLAVLWKDIRRDDDDAGEEGEEARARVFARAFAVFNADQVDGYAPAPKPVLPESERLAQAEAFIAALNIPVSFGAPYAYYHLVKDQVFLPDFAAFHDAHGFYATWLHECAHATGAKHRLDRDFTGKWTKDALAMEEATAELTASFLLADLGIAHHPREDHAAYVASWLRLLKDEPRAIFTAAGKAQAAADWMHTRQPGAT